MKKINLSKKTVRPSKKTVRAQLLELFYQFPQQSFTVREIGRKLKVGHSSVQYNLKQLKEDGIISVDNTWKDSWQNRFIKSQYYLIKIIESGLVDYLDQELAAKSIIVFGSFRKGESIKGSDLDIFVECAKEKKLNLRKFELKIGAPVQLFTKPNINLLPKTLLNNVINGIKLKGYFTIK